MNKKDVQLLCAVLGILVAVLSWQFVYNPNQEKAEQISAENDTLRQTIKELEALEANRETYLEDTETMKTECNDVIAKFPADFLSEDKVMYLYNMENVPQNQVVIPSVSLGQQAEVPYTGQTVVGEYELQDDGIKMYMAQDDISFYTTYSGLKNIIQYVYEIPGRKSISTISLTAGADGYLGGSMSVDFYALTGTEKLYTPLDIRGVTLGKDNIFGMLEGSSEEDTEESDEESGEEADEDNEDEE